MLAQDIAVHEYTGYRYSDPVITEIGIRQKMEAELMKRLRFERLMFDLSARFVSLCPYHMDIEIQDALQLILEFFRVDRCALVRIMQDGSHWQIAHIASADGLPDLPVRVDLPVDLYPWMFKNIVERHEVLAFPTLEQMPPEAEIDRRTYEEWGIRSILNVPINVEGASIYVLAIASHHRECVWPEDYIPRLRIMGETLVRALQLARAENRLAERERFERLVSEVSAGFIIDAAKDVKEMIRHWLRRIADFFQADGCGLRMFSEDGSRLAQVVEYHRENFDPVPSNLSTDDLAWYADQLRQEKPVVINRLDDIPEAAENERLFCMARNIKSLLSVPITSGGRTIGACSLASVRAERQWPKDLIRRMQFVAEIFAAALARNRTEIRLRERLNQNERFRTRLVNENLHLRKKTEAHPIHKDIVGQSRAMNEILAKIRQVAQTDATVLIAGETGTGKELLAQAVHRLSLRGKKCLIAVNCAALPPALIESELFGREKGAYTGALTRMAGRFELAHGATLFLDEIGELPPDIQAKLLRVLEEGKFERLGSSKTLRADVRVIAATNRDLAKMTVGGQFRKDLFYRLNVFPITVPPLRERPEDIPMLVWAFIRKFEKKMGKRIERIAREGMAEMIRYPWPGNARELKNMVERAMILSSGKVLDLRPPRDPEPSCLPEENLSLADAEREHILRVLEKCRWRLSGDGGAAEILGLKRTTLQSKMKRLGIRRSSE